MVLGMKETQKKTTPKKNSAEKNLNVNTAKPNLHEKYVGRVVFPSKKTSKKSEKKNLRKVIQYVEGTLVSKESKSSSNLKVVKKQSIKGSQKATIYRTQEHLLSHKFVQCKISGANEDGEVTLPEEIKPLLINVTFLLHELKQKQKSKYGEELCGMISNIATLLTELSRRPIQRMNDANKQAKHFDEIAIKLVTAINKYNKPDIKKCENFVNDTEILEQKLEQKESDVKKLKKQILEEQSGFLSEPKNIDDCLRNSIAKNLSLKAEIKYHKAQLRKYVKLLARKELLKQKSEDELMTLQKKLDEIESTVENSESSMKTKLFNKIVNVTHGESLMKYAKSKVGGLKKKGEQNVTTATNVKQPRVPSRKI